jgi:restriction system protein
MRCPTRFAHRSCKKRNQYESRRSVAVRDYLEHIAQAIANILEYTAGMDAAAYLGDKWSPGVFEAIEWRRFEAVWEKLFAQAGFEARTQSHGADGGVDIWLHSRHSEGPAAIVQCKHWHGKQVGVKELREFYGVMASHKLKRGTYATTSTYTADATLFARQNGISALDGNGLLSLIARRTPEQQMELLQTAYEGEYWRPTCANCGVKMVEREKKKDKAPFWGCARYPKCSSTLPMRQTS